MSNKYCDHGAYNNATFVASTAGLSTTLTVTSVTSGAVAPGQFIVGTGITAVASPVLGTYITAVTYNAANGVTSVTMSAAMTVPAGTTITASYGDPAAVPLWGQAQDGDGTASTMATPSTAEIVFTGVPTAGVIAVLGITTAVTWATSADNCANLLATAINALATVATSPDSFSKKGPVRNHLYARGPATGAPSGTCQIMTRQGSSNHAGLIAITHTLDNVSSAGTINFVGGSGGAWGYLYRNWSYAFWPTSNISYAVTTGIVYCGALVAGDVVNVRSGKTVPTYHLNGPGFLTMGSASQPIQFLIDDSTIWADGVDPVFVQDGQAIDYSAQTYLFTGSTTSFVIFAARQYASGVRSYKLISRKRYWGGPGFGTRIRPAGGLCILSNIHFENTTSNGAVTIYWAQYYSQPQTSATLNNCYVKNSENVQFLSAGEESALCDLTMNGCEFEYTGGAISTVITGNAYGGWVTINGLKMTGFITGSSLLALSTGAVDLCMTNCDFGGVTLRGPYYGAWTIGNGDSTPYIAISDMSAAGDFSTDTRMGFCEWNHSLGFPVRAAVLLDGITPWSMRVIPNRAAQLKATRYLTAPPLHKINSLSTAARTITVHLLVDTTITASYSQGDLWIVVSYIQSDGVRRSVGLPGSLSTLLEFDAAAAWDKTTFVSGGTLNYDKRKVILTTPTAILTDSLIAVDVCFGKSVSNATQFFFVCPEVEVA